MLDVYVLVKGNSESSFCTDYLLCESFLVSGPKLWYSLPIQIRQSSSLITFKKAVKSFYLSEQLDDP